MAHAMVCNTYCRHKPQHSVCTIVLILHVAFHMFFDTCSCCYVSSENLWVYMTYNSP